MRVYNKGKTNSLTKDLEVISEILSSVGKTKMFLTVNEKTRPDGRKFISGFGLSQVAHVSISTAYNFLEKMVTYGVFEYPAEIDGVKKVRITMYGKEIHQRIKKSTPDYDTI